MHFGEDVAGEWVPLDDLELTMDVGGEFSFSASPREVFRRSPNYIRFHDGDCFIRFLDRESVYQDLKGARDIAYLLHRPREPVPTYHLVYGIDGMSPDDIASGRQESASQDGDFVEDNYSLVSVNRERKRLRNLLLKLKRARIKLDAGTPDRIKLDNDILVVESELAFANQLEQQSPKGKARRAIGRRLDTFLEKVKQEDPHLYDHLARSIKPRYGYSIRYAPQKTTAWEVEW